MNIKKQEQQFLEKIKNLSAKTVDVYLDSPQDFTEKADLSSPEGLVLSSSVREYLDNAAQDINIKNSIHIALHFRDGSSPEPQQFQKLIQNYYGSRLESLMAQRLKNSKHWRFRLLTGLIFLACCHAVSLLLASFTDSSITSLLQDSFEIMGWVAIWEPSSYFLFKRKEEDHDLSDCFQLKHATVSVS